MNTFNCFQAIGFYTCLPLLIQWLFQNQYNVWGYISAGILAVGYVAISITLSSSVK
ncbi:MAG: hypothetical protein ACK41T_00770 [Pseudobdellovibrio sp.]